MVALRVLLAAVTILLAQAASAEELRGRIVGIADGDTLTLLTERREEVRILLAVIDTPESGQPYGSRDGSPAMRAGISQWFKIVAEHGRVSGPAASLDTPRCIGSNALPRLAASWAPPGLAPPISEDGAGAEPRTGPRGLGCGG